MAKNGQFGEISSKQRRMIAALLTYPTIGEACEFVGIGRTTLRRWQKNPNFKAALNNAEEELISATGCRLAARLNDAISVLLNLMNSSKPAEEIRAACAIADYTLKFHNLDIEARLAELEAKVYDTP
jgi:hypothetical protein